MIIPNKPRPLILQKKLWLTLGLLAVLSAVGFWVFGKKPSNTESSSVKLVPVRQETLMKFVAATGKIVANFEVEIKAKASGRIIRLPYDVSDSVKQGELLVELDPIDESRQVNQAQASLAGLQSRVDQNAINLQVARRNLSTDLAKARFDLNAAQAKYKEAKAKEKRLADLAKDRYISQQEYESGMTTAVQAATDLSNAQVRLRELQTQEIGLKAQAQDIRIAASEAQAQRVALATSQQRLSETRIYAPINGVITSRLGQLGAIVSSGISNVGGGTAIMTLADLSRIFVLASVDESDIGQVTEGQPVTITSDSFPGEQFTGRVVRIAPKGVEESNVVTFEVKIEVDGANKKLLKPEMTTNVEILTAEKKNALTIPSESVFTENGTSFVKIPDKTGQLAHRTVLVGLNNGSRTEVLRGLSLGEKVALEQGQSHSRWRRGNDSPSSSAAKTQRGQMMMMRGMGRR